MKTTEQKVREVLIHELRGHKNSLIQELTDKIMSCFSAERIQFCEYRKTVK